MHFYCTPQIGLALKIIKGRYPPIHSRYSSNLRDLIQRMLSTVSRSIPSILLYILTLITHALNLGVLSLEIRLLGHKCIDRGIEQMLPPFSSSPLTTIISDRLQSLDQICMTYLRKCHVTVMVGRHTHPSFFYYLSD